MSAPRPSPCRSTTRPIRRGRPAALQFLDHALCDVARLPVREVVSANHFVTGLTLGLGKVVFDYLAKA